MQHLNCGRNAFFNSCFHQSVWYFSRFKRLHGACCVKPMAGLPGLGGGGRVGNTTAVALLPPTQTQRTISVLHQDFVKTSLRDQEKSQWLWWNEHIAYNMPLFIKAIFWFSVSNRQSIWKNCFCFVTDADVLIKVMWDVRGARTGVYLFLNLWSQPANHQEIFQIMWDINKISTLSEIWFWSVLCSLHLVRDCQEVECSR